MPSLYLRLLSSCDSNEYQVRTPRPQRILLKTQDQQTGLVDTSVKQTSIL